MRLGIALLRAASAAVVVVHSPSALEGEFVPQPHVEPASALGRVAYRHATREPALWLFHWRGKWMFGDAPGVDAAVAFIESAAVTPCDFAAASPRAAWRMHDAGAWHAAPALNLSCAPPRALFAADDASACSDAALSPTIALANGVAMPRVGLGTAGLRNDADVLRWALAAGYALVDTASRNHPAYENEALVGEAVRAHATGRGGGVFISTKLSPAAHGLDAARAGMSDALRALRVDQVDLVLIHHPACLMRPPGDACEGTWEDTWRALERLYAEGYARAIGVCNFDAPTLARLFELAVAPVAVVQNWMDPFHQDADARALAAARGAAYQSFSTMGRQYVARYVDGELVNVGENPVLADATLGAIARKHARSPAAIALRWALQLGAAIIPQSSREDRVRENLRALDRDFALDDDDMAAIAALEGRVTKG